MGSLWKINIDFGHSIGICSKVCVCVYVCICLYVFVVWHGLGTFFSPYLVSCVCVCAYVHFVSLLQRNAMQVNNHILLAIALFEWKRWLENLKCWKIALLLCPIGHRCVAKLNREKNNTLKHERINDNFVSASKLVQTANNRKKHQQQ